MEEKSSSWLFTLLSSRNEQIPILDTIIFTENHPLKYLYNKSTGEIHETPAQPLQTLTSTLSSLEYPPSKVICALITQASCKYIKKAQIRSLPSKSFQNLLQIQLLYPKKNLQIFSNILCDVSFIDQRYKSQISVKTQSGSERLSNPFMKNNAKEICETILRAIKAEEHSQLLKLQIELISDAQGSLYLHRVVSCILASSLRSVHFSISSAVELNDYIAGSKKVRTKSLFEKNSDQDSKKESLNISIDSVEENNRLKVPEPQELNKGFKGNDAKNKRRTLCNRVKSFDFIRTDRKSTLPKEDRKGTLVECEEKLEDSWDYGAVDVDFLEMISRQALRCGNSLRPITPTYEEIKLKMRQINEKFSLTPCGFRSPEYRTEAIKIKVNGEQFRSSLENNPNKLAAVELPSIQRSQKSAQGFTPLFPLSKKSLLKSPRNKYFNL